MARFWTRNLTTYRVLIFLYHLGQKLFPQTVLGQWNSSLDPHIIWITPGLGWKAIYVETLYSAFLSAKFDSVSITFFVYHRGRKFFSSQTVLGQWNSSLDPQFIWISPGLGWKAIYVETLYSAFLSAKFDNISITFFVYHRGQKFLPPPECTRTVKLLPRTSIHLKKSLTRLKSDLCWNSR